MEGWVQIGKRRINLNHARQIERRDDGSVTVIFPTGAANLPDTIVLEGDEADGVWRHSRARPIVSTQHPGEAEVQEEPWIVVKDPAAPAPADDTPAVAAPQPQAAVTA